MNKMSRNEMWQEMSLQEMKEVNGGSLPKIAWEIITAVAIYVSDNIEDVREGFSDGLKNEPRY